MIFSSFCDVVQYRLQYQTEMEKNKNWYFWKINSENGSTMFIVFWKNLENVRKKGSGIVPLHLRNGTTELMESEGYVQDYKYVHSYDNHFEEQNYFPETFLDSPVFYYPQNTGREKFIKERLEKLWKNRYK